MKLFWVIISVFVIAAIAVAYAQFTGGASTQLAAGPEVPAQRTHESANQPSPAERVPESRSGLFAEPAPAQSEPADATDGEDQVVQHEAADRDHDAEAAELVEDLLAVADELREDDGPTSITPSRAGNHEHQQVQVSDNPWAIEGELPLGDERMASQRLQHSVVQQDDGSLLLDDTFIIRGNGTKASPYEITWDLLMSAAETYQPRLGMEEIPQRVALLDGKHVKITGHLMFPMVTAQADELLVMLNMWDGCCIGTMPSPYDAIEVQLGTPAPGGNQQYFNYGSIEGTLVIDPYLINDWLIGLYLIEDATLKVGM